VPFISRNCIETIRRQLNIVDVVSAHVNLRREGNTWKGLSPFTNEKTPSFTVNPDKGFYYCFSSSQGGDIFRFVQQVENLSFNEAVETLARRHGIALEYEDGKGPGEEERSLRAEMLELHELATDYFHRAFKAPTGHGQTIRDYWTGNRRFSPETADEFQVGFSPPGDTGLLEAARRKNYSMEALVQCGLFYARPGESDPRRLRPRFRGRLMIPIRDVQGRVVAFTARQTDLTPENDPPGKYINSPETPLFRKSDIVFNIDRARQHVKEARQFLLVEGQLDAVRCWSVGLKTAVAPQGTAITAQQLAILRRYEPDSVLVLLDGDAAGTRAAARALAMGLELGLELRFATLKEGEDPDDLLADGGAPALEPIRERAQKPMEFAVAHYLPEGTRAAPRERATAIRRICEMLAQCPSAVEAHGHLEQAATRMGLEHHVVLEEFERIRERRPGTGVNRKSDETGSFSPQKLTNALSELLLLCLHHQPRIPEIAQIVDPEWISPDSQDGQLLLRLLADFKETIRDSLEHIDDLADTEDEQRRLFTLLNSPPKTDEPIEAINICLKRIYENFMAERIREVENRLVNTPPGDPGAEALLRERADRRKLLKSPPQLQSSVSQH